MRSSIAARQSRPSLAHIMHSCTTSRMCEKRWQGEGRYQQGEELFGKNQSANATESGHTTPTRNSKGNERILAVGLRHAPDFLAFVTIAVAKAQHEAKTIEAFSTHSWASSAAHIYAMVATFGICENGHNTHTCGCLTFLCTSPIYTMSCKCQQAEVMVGGHIL